MLKTSAQQLTLSKVHSLSMKGKKRKECEGVAAYLEFNTAHCMWDCTKCQDVVHIAERLYMLLRHQKLLLHMPTAQFQCDLLILKPFPFCSHDGQHQRLSSQLKP